ncbi:MAG: sulfatase [Planctomycetaceae bacterium]|nr:sulfatase [bacterium]MDB4679560.1 sulfatase [Planctomycetaceae bacterium]MDG2390580.1 sulfatase [Planctomycetaceae bacterium]
MTNSLRGSFFFIAAFLFVPIALSADDARPNILFFFADDWGRYASVYSDPDIPSLNDVIKTPNIDRIANEGVRFQNAFVPVASCGPCRASLATGRHFWNCGSGAFLNGKASNWKGYENPFLTLPKFPDLLRENGYYTQRSQKTFSFRASKPTPAAHKIAQVPYQRYGLYVSEAEHGDAQKQRRVEVLAHPRTEMKRVLAGCPDGSPFFFVYGSINVHRPYSADSGKKLWNIDPDRLKGLIPKFLPDVDDVRRDFSDYLGEVQALDAMLGVMLEELEATGELDNTLIILSGDHGIPGVPRGKTNCYDLASRVPLMARWPYKIKAGRVVEDFVSIMDVGPTLLDVADVKIPNSMEGRSFRKQLVSQPNGWIDPNRNSVIIGRELHFHTARAGNLPYPMRAVRTPDYLYIRNFKPDRWPMGDPRGLLKGPAPSYESLHKQTATTMSDLDASLTKAWMVTHRFSSEEQPLFDLTLGLRPKEELYDLTSDPHQLKNLATHSDYQQTKIMLAAQLQQVLEQSQDPRLNDAFDHLPYVDPKKTASED